MNLAENTLKLYPTVHFKEKALCRYELKLNNHLSKYSRVNQEMQTDSIRASLGLSTGLPCRS
jgi:hypothetical protein